MFGSTARLEAQVQAQARELAQTATALNGHLNDCSRRYDDTRQSLDKLESALEKSSEDRRKSIQALDKKFEDKHRENRKFLAAIFVAVLGALALKLTDFIHIPPMAGH